ncbi:MAG: molybdopterin-guanine dinucleotide biosynthesis protein B [Clostridia bacterium]|nr:molybdopterin-guanine dinucleotide biosynthesis protein B [Clostridia bacterium]
MNNPASHMTLGILAGGRSSRMGKNKAELGAVNEEGTFLQHLVSLGSPFNDVIVSQDVEGRYSIPGIRTVTDRTEGYGPLEGIIRILEASWTEYAVIVATDMPNMTGELLQALTSRVKGTEGCVVLTKEGRPEPLCSVYSKKTLGELKVMISENLHSPRLLFDRVDTEFVGIEELGIDPLTVYNVNTPEEYEIYTASAERSEKPPKKWYEGPGYPPVFGICGTKKTGKTSIMVAVVSQLTARGYKVAAIKHDGHDFEPDSPGTDSFFVRRAGANDTAVFSDSHVSYNQDLEGAAPGEVLENLLRLAGSRPDIVLVEGLKNESHPKLDLNENPQELTEENFTRITDYIEKTYLKV